jgi:hypothetical protein
MYSPIHSIYSLFDHSLFDHLGLDSSEQAVNTFVS